ncbi:MAG TPA: cell division protein SepF [Clostridia bacterium]|nr:cell division protein SepF [Clostridia bacterium]
MGEKISDKIKYFMGVDDQSDETIESESVKTNEFVQRKTTVNEDDSVETSSPVNKVYDISRSRMRVVIHSPSNFEESEKIVKNLLENKPVILNLSKLEEGVTNKVFNFCSGALCALQGHMIKIDNGIFLLAPSNIDVTGDIKEELEAKGMFSWN